MNEKMNTFQVEDEYYVPFADKTRISIQRGEGVYVWDEDGKKYIDLTGGWGVTSIGHANPVITEAILNQSKKIIQNPNSGATYSPIRSKLLLLMHKLLPSTLKRIFFTNSGAEANDAAIKLARKVTGRSNIISTEMSFHGRTISTLSATGQSLHRNKFKPLMPGYCFVPYNDVEAVEEIIKNDIAAVIVEPIQGEGGVNIPSEGYIADLSKLCIKNDVLLIMDEIQTGFFRTGPIFMSYVENVKVDILTMAKGIAGGFPLGAFAITEDIANKIEVGDHGGTYSGNPLACAVAYSVIKYMMNNKISENVEDVGKFTFQELNKWSKEYPHIIRDIRGKGLLIAIELSDEAVTEEINAKCIEHGLILNIKHGKIIRIFPALNISKEEMKEGLDILKKSLDQYAENQSQ